MRVNYSTPTGDNHLPSAWDIQKKHPKAMTEKSNFIVSSQGNVWMFKC